MKGHVENYLRTLIIHSYFKVNDFSNSNLTDRLEYLDKPLFLWCGTLPVAEIYNSESSAFRNWWAAEILTHCHRHKEVEFSLKERPRSTWAAFTSYQHFILERDRAHHACHNTACGLTFCCVPRSTSASSSKSSTWQDTWSRRWEKVMRRMFGVWMWSWTMRHVGVKCP